MTRCVTMSTALKDEEPEKPVKKGFCGSVVICLWKSDGVNCYAPYECKHLNE